MISSDTFWKRLQRYPPVLIRLLSRKRHGRPLTSHEIATRGGLKVGQVEWISEAHDWVGIDLPTFRAFTKGCDVDLLSRTDWRRIENYMAGTKVGGRRFPPNFRYLKISPQWNSYYKALIAGWLKSSKKI